MSNTIPTTYLSEVAATRDVEIDSLRSEIADGLKILASSDAGMEIVCPNPEQILIAKVELARKLIRQALDLNTLLDESERLDVHGNPAVVSAEFVNVQTHCQPYLAKR